MANQQFFIERLNPALQMLLSVSDEGKILKTILSK